MENKKITFFTLLLFASFGFVLGCAQTKMDEKAVATVESQPMTGNPVELVNQLNRKLTDARMNHLNILSPTWFEKA